MVWAINFYGFCALWTFILKPEVRVPFWSFGVLSFSTVFLSFSDFHTSNVNIGGSFALFTVYDR